ncbi:plasmid mobilization relaxosome protein MobC [Bacillus thuringiensis]|nr:plasmid mobilization relaxosome protein MobC [Bacillus thuringiensis]MED2824435.1 plasmid mobilization relaxosome protein MobC [Bacillus thuringiensis]MED3609985.1 plasmid mobilization relaxosome protein MobC [Bacillus thuringiensis]
MSERDDNMASENSNKEQKQPIRKEPRQISFRVSESEYLKLQQSAETLNMSVPTFVKKKAQGSRLVAPKFDKATRQSIARDLSMLGNNMNQIAKYCNSNRHGGVEWEKLNDSIEGMRKELNRLWQQLN